ncbi:MAG: SMC-Scp complex subunit ScpB [Candidatus Komeilibacteria bacterium]|nr:SMC-Scp complex subunit ScpB [Candidatus Komeilibacteria bacterium]
MSNLKSQLESILLVTSKPISQKKLAEVLAVKVKDLEPVIEELTAEYNQQGRGLRLLVNNDQLQLASAPENSELVKQYLKDDLTGELTDPSIETLTIIAYRQPISKAELEQIRGVNCSLIIRNLMIRGLVEAEYNKQRATTLYSVTLDFLKYLGLNKVNELPDFEKLNNDDNLQKLLNQNAGSPQSAEAGRQEAVVEEVFKVEVRKE